MVACTSLYAFTSLGHALLKDTVAFTSGHLVFPQLHPAVPPFDDLEGSPAT